VGTMVIIKVYMGLPLEGLYVELICRVLCKGFNMRNIEEKYLNKNM
jgi:hypothetical protein